MPREQIHPYAVEAIRLLGTQVAIARRERAMPEAELAERIGVSRSTVRRIERGDRRVAIGTMLDAAAVLGVPLFHPEPDRLQLELARATDALRLLPDRVRLGGRDLDDDF